MITDSYQPYVPKTKYQKYRRGIGMRLAVHGPDNSKMLKFVCWIRNLDGDYEASKRKTAGKVAVAALAVFGMLLTTPFFIGTYLFFKFVECNVQVSRDHKRWHFFDDMHRRETETHLAIIEALGGTEACQQIPVEFYIHTQKLAMKGGQEQIDYLFNTDNIRSQGAAEMRQIFETNRNPTFQSADNFVALWVENRETHDRDICLIYKDEKSAFWSFDQLQETDDINAHDRIPGFGLFDAESSIPTIKSIVAGTHPDYRLVTFDN